MRRLSLAAGFVLVAASAGAQAPSPFTPLGPAQAPRPAAPVQIPAIITPGQGVAIQSQPLPVLTAPDPALPAPGAPAIVQPTPVPPPAAPVLAPVLAPVPAARAPAPSSASPAAPSATPVPGTPIAGDWQQRTAVDLVALDKVTARTTALTGKVGDTLRFGSLAIVLRGCVARPADQAADAAAFLDITDRAGAAVFRGWMVASMPALAIIEHPVYDIRLAACRP